jgi:hypothetical protein
MLFVGTLSLCARTGAGAGTAADVVRGFVLPLDDDMEAGLDVLVFDVLVDDDDVVLFADVLASSTSRFDTAAVDNWKRRRA